MIQKILAYCISYQIKASGIIQRFIFRLKNFLRLADRPGFQTIDNLIPDQLYPRQFHLIIYTACPEGPPCRCDTDAFQPGMQLCFQPPFYLFRQRGNFFYILNLPVDHCPFRVLFFFNGNDLHLIILNDTHHPDDTACADIQGKYHIACLGFCLCRHLHLRLFHLSFRHLILPLIHFLSF